MIAGMVITSLSLVHLGMSPSVVTLPMSITLLLHHQGLQLTFSTKHRQNRSSSGNRLLPSFNASGLIRPLPKRAPSSTNVYSSNRPPVIDLNNESRPAVARASGSRFAAAPCNSIEPISDGMGDSAHQQPLECPGQQRNVGLRHSISICTCIL